MKFFKMFPSYLNLNLKIIQKKNLRKSLKS